MSSSNAAERTPAAVSGTMVGNYLLGRVIGKGLSSEVRLATDTRNKQLVAIKIMEKEWIWKNDMSSLVRREIDIIQDLDHPSVVKLIEVFNSQTHVFMAMEAVDGRDLHAEVTRTGKLHEDRARELFQQMIGAVEYLHSIGVAHRDLKLENLLISRDGQTLKVTDFGLAVRMHEWEGDSKKKRPWVTKRNHRRQKSSCGTPSYAAPEVISSSRSKMYDARHVDIWCSGVVLYVMVTGNMPFQGGNVDATLRLVREKEPVYPDFLSPEITDLLRGMLQKDPGKRLAVAGIMSHPWSSRPQSLKPFQRPTRLPDPRGIREAAPSDDPAAVAREAIEKAKKAALAAEKAAADARAADVLAEEALAAAAQAQAARAASPAVVSRRAAVHPMRGRDTRSRPPPLMPSPSESNAAGTKITRRFGRSSSMDESDNALAAYRRSFMSRSASETPGEVAGRPRDDDDRRRQRHESVETRTASDQDGRRGAFISGLKDPNKALDGVFASTAASPNAPDTNAILARRKLLLRSRSNSLPSNQVDATLSRVSPKPLATTGSAEPTTAGGVQGLPGAHRTKHEEGTYSSTRERARRDSESSNGGRLTPTAYDSPKKGANAKTHVSRAVIDRSLSSVFAATSASLSEEKAAEATPEQEGTLSSGGSITFDVVPCPVSENTVGESVSDGSSRKNSTQRNSSGPVAETAMCKVDGHMDVTARDLRPSASQEAQTITQPVSSRMIVELGTTAAAQEPSKSDHSSPQISVRTTNMPPLHDHATRAVSDGPLPPYEEDMSIPELSAAHTVSGILGKTAKALDPSTVDDAPQTSPLRSSKPSGHGRSDSQVEVAPESVVEGNVGSDSGRGTTGSQASIKVDLAVHSTIEKSDSTHDIKQAEKTALSIEPLPKGSMLRATVDGARSTEHVKQPEELEASREPSANDSTCDSKANETASCDGETQSNECAVSAESLLGDSTAVAAVGEREAANAEDFKEPAETMEALPNDAMAHMTVGDVSGTDALKQRGEPAASIQQLPNDLVAPATRGEISWAEVMKQTQEPQASSDSLSDNLTYHVTEGEMSVTDRVKCIEDAGSSIEELSDSAVQTMVSHEIAPDEVKLPHVQEPGLPTEQGPNDPSAKASEGRPIYDKSAEPFAVTRTAVAVQPPPPSYEEAYSRSKIVSHKQPDSTVIKQTAAATATSSLTTITIDTTDLLTAEDDAACSPSQQGSLRRAPTEKRSKSPRPRRATSPTLRGLSTGRGGTSHGRPAPQRKPSPPKRPTQRAPSVYRRPKHRTSQGRGSSAKSGASNVSGGLRTHALSATPAGMPKRGRSSERPTSQAVRGDRSRSHSPKSRLRTSQADFSSEKGKARSFVDVETTDTAETEDTADMEDMDGVMDEKNQSGEEKYTGWLAGVANPRPASANLRKLAAEENIWVSADDSVLARRHNSATLMSSNLEADVPKRAVSVSLIRSAALGLPAIARFPSKTTADTTEAIGAGGWAASTSSTSHGTFALASARNVDSKKTRKRGKGFGRAIARIIFWRRDP